MSWIPSAQQRSSSSNDRSSFQGSDGGSQSGQGRKEQYKVYVQNIPMDMEKESVDEFFSKCGEVVYSKILEPKDGRTTLAGFISYSTEEAVEEAIQKLSGCSLGDAPPLRVMRPKSSSNNQSGGGQTCHKCGEAGHFSRECPNNTSGGGQTCHKCGKAGHFSRECPNNTSGGGQTCHKCGEAGHFSRECPNNTSGGKTCHKCGEAGHFSRECPNNTSGDNNRPNNDRNNRFGAGAGSSGGSRFGQMHNNGPSFNQEKSPFSSNNSYVPNSNSGFRGNTGYHGNQSDTQQSFKSMLGRGEARNPSESSRPGQNSQSNTSYPPLAPLRKNGPPQPVQNGYQQQIPDQNQGYQEQQQNQGYQPPSTTQAQYQDQQTTQDYQEHPPTQAYQQPPGPAQGYQEQPPAQAYQQPPGPAPDYQEQPPNQGYQQPSPGYQEQPPAQAYQQPPGPATGYQEHPPAQAYQQPPGPSPGYQEQPPNQGYQQQSPGYQEQQPDQGYQYNTPGQQGYQEPKPSQQQYQEQPSNQPPQQYGYNEQPAETSSQYNPGYNEQAPQQNFQEQSPQQETQPHYPETTPQQNYAGQPPQQSYPETTPQQSYTGQPPQQSYPETTPQQSNTGQTPQQSNAGQTYNDQSPKPSYDQQLPQQSYKEQPSHDPSHDTNQSNTSASVNQSRSWADSFSSGMQNGSATSQEQSSWQPKSNDDRSSGGRDRVCHNCKEPGHFSRECPNPRQQGSQTCHRCGEEGHFARECPNNTGSSCHKCGEVGHFARECPNKSGPGDNQLCHRCGEAGHFARDCSQSPNRAGPTCHKCGKVGHISRECSESPTRGGGDGCHRCGEDGHFARECPNIEADPNRPAPVTYIPEELPNDMEELFRDVPHSGINFDKYDNIPVKVSGVNEPPPIQAFEDANFGSQCRANIHRAGFVKPTPVQKYTFPIVLSGRDLMACAQTGSGKTVAFLLPTLTNIISRGLPSASRSPLVLCLAPTRELVIQIYKEAKKFSDGTPVKVSVVYGGVSVAYQAQQLEQGCHFLAATPGRLQDFISRERVYLDNIQYLILDEADRMLDMGFEPAIRKIVEQSNMTDKLNRQTLMFSATFPDEIQRLAWDFLKTDFLFLAVGRVGGSNLDIQQNVLQVNGNDKRDKLFDILNASGRDRTLVFVELKRVADFLACLLSENNFPTTSISSDRNQSEREAALRDFRNGRAYVMVATSVAARGLDIPDVKHVVNYDLPQDIDSYVHRIGRTGRIGNQGKATSFFEQGRDEKLARSLVKVLSEASQDVPSWLEKVAEDAVGSSYGPKGGRFSAKDQREGGGPRGRRNDYQSPGVPNFNTDSMASSQFGSQAPTYNSNSMQNGPTSSMPHQGNPSYSAGGGATGGSDDDWD